MSQGNVEIVRRALGARRSEFEELLDPAVRLDFSERVFNPAVLEGYAGIMRWRAEIGEVWGSYRSEPEEFLDAGDVVFTHEYGCGKGSGAVQPSGNSCDERAAAEVQGDKRPRCASAVEPRSRGRRNGGT